MPHITPINIIIIPHEYTCLLVLAAKNGVMHHLATESLCCFAAILYCVATAPELRCMAAASQLHNVSILPNGEQKVMVLLPKCIGSILNATMGVGLLYNFLVNTKAMGLANI